MGDYIQALGKTLGSTNILLEEMKAEIKKNNKTTKKHNFWIRTLTVFIALLTAITVASTVLPYLDQIGIDLPEPGRYALSSQEFSLYVIDTKTGEVWERKHLGDKNYYWDTHVGRR